ncbi:MAG TPA: isoprenylcysteine carboxylmethyltransferase family protein [Terriglobales bacterium]|nr:isoprenylcysteine carboxylmethyltransferase family protein [Terriglobales bacterium]
MPLIHNYLFPAMWISYLAYWWAMSRNVKETKHRESVPPRLLRLVTLACAVALLWLPSVPLPFLNERFLPLRPWCFWGGAAVTAGGLLFSVRARRHLGNNWSQAVTVKEGHELITSGPYALVRHPIYTGLLLAFLGCAVARGEWRGLLAVALVFGALWRKLRLEEKWMRAQFGESYEAYSRQVAALVPYIIRR